MDISNLYHVGIVADDVPAAMRQLEQTLGVRWAAVRRRQGQRMTESGPVDFDIVTAYSVDGPILFEVANRQSWTESTVGIDHLAFWVDDFDAEAAPLRADGWAQVMSFYLRAPNGVKVELVPRAEYEPRLTRYLAGGNYFDE